MTTATGSPVPTTRARRARRGARRRPIPTSRLVEGRAAQDVRHPRGLLADGQRRHRVRARHRRGHPLGARRGDHPGDVRHRDRHAAVGGAADHRDPLDHQRVQPAHRPDDVHARAVARTRDGLQAGRHLAIGVASMVLALGVGAARQPRSARPSPGCDAVWDISVRARSATSCWPTCSAC